MNTLSVSWFNPVLVQIGSIKIHWYGVMYAVTFALAYCYLHWSRQGRALPLSGEQKDTLLGFVIAGVLIGGRIGYVLFYNLAYYLGAPLKIFAVWEGGMSFHGGLIGAILMLWLFARREKVKFLVLSDIVTAFAPVGIFLVRIGNFINGELYGRALSTGLKGGPYLCFRFPADPANCRYPSQLFEAFLEGLVLFGVLWVIRKKGVRPGVVSASFLIFYGIFRIACEFFREPDVQIGFLPFGATEGQVLSLLMILAGVVVAVYLKRARTRS